MLGKWLKLEDGQMRVFSKVGNRCPEVDVCRAVKCRLSDAVDAELCGGGRRLNAVARLDFHEDGVVAMQLGCDRQETAVADATARRPTALRLRDWHRPANDNQLADSRDFGWLGSRVVSVLEWTQAQKGPGLNRSRNAAG